MKQRASIVLLLAGLLLVGCGNSPVARTADPLATSTPTPVPTSTPISPPTTTPLPQPAATPAFVPTATITPVPLQTATQPSPALDRTVREPNDCIVVRYPSTWYVSDHGMENDPSQCPGAFAFNNQKILTPCDGSILQDSPHLFFKVADAPGENLDSAHQAVYIYLSGKRCQTLDEQAQQLQIAAAAANKDASNQDQAETFQREISGTTAACLAANGQGAAKSARVQYCYLLISGMMYALVSSGPSADYATVDRILTGLAIHPMT